MNDIKPYIRNLRQALFVPVLTLAVVFCLALQPSVALQAVPTGAIHSMPGTETGFSRDFNPIFLKGLRINPENPLHFEFVVDPGDTELSDAEFTAETDKLMDYFFAALRIPDEDLWVNLSPYEHQRVIAPDFAATRMGRDLLAQDYHLKQVAASVLYPVHDLGREFWLQVSHRAAQEFGSSDLPVNTFSKIWIVPKVAVVRVEDNAAYVVGTRLRVVLDEDLRSDRHAQDLERFRVHAEADSMREIILDVMRDIILPELEEEVNHGENFAELRQIYHTLILARWYKRNLLDTALGKVDLDNLGTGDFFGKKAAQKIYQRYLRDLEAEVRGIQVHAGGGIKTAPRPYFSGGVLFGAPLADVYREVDMPGAPAYDSRRLAGTYPEL